MFQKIMEILYSPNLSVHYDSEKLLVLACDTSPYGLGAVLSSILPDAYEKLLAYSSRALSSSEKNYFQIERESLAIILVIKKFN